jgi:N-acetylglucosaminyldiphosphoundecaprenol N-acetyl-beta-D-mannosaminyltransferase
MAMKHRRAHMARAPEGRPLERICLLGCPLDNLTTEEALARIEEFIQQGTPHQHVAINVSKIVMFHRDPQLRAIVLDSDLLCADGQPLVWLSRLAGTPLKGRLTGIDLMGLLLERAAKKRYRVYFLGGRPKVVAAAVGECRRRYPNLNVAGYRDGYWQPKDEVAVVAAIRQASPDLLLVALGSPQKELFIHRHRAALGVPFSMGVGGSFDVLAELTRRAPVWMRRAGLEWTWRIVQEPGRMWKRYARDGIWFGYLVAKQLLRRTP